VAAQRPVSGDSYSGARGPAVQGGGRRWVRLPAQGRWIRLALEGAGCVRRMFASTLVPWLQVENLVNCCGFVALGGPVLSLSRMLVPREGRCNRTIVHHGDGS
jgi:hypothetical protein